MWKALVRRRDFLELILAGKRLKAMQVNDMFERELLPLGAEEILVFWQNDPSISDEMPVAVVVHEDKVFELLAIVNSSPNLPAPFTAFCRVLSIKEMEAYSESYKPIRANVINGLVGVAISEAIIYSGTIDKIVEINPAACKRTLTYAWASAIVSCPKSILDRVVENWFQVQRLVNPYARFENMSMIRSATHTIFTLAAEIYHGFPPSNALGAFCSEIVELGEPSEETWNELAGHLPSVLKIETLKAATREDRALYYQQALSYVYKSKTSSTSDSDVAICAFIATRIAPGSFEHMRILASEADPRLMLWYGFFAALQRNSSALRSISGLGLRIRRDLFNKCLMSDAPIADIAFNELKIVEKIGVDSLVRKLGHSNEINVEICPLLTCAFRYNVKMQKQYDYHDVQQRQQEMPMIVEKITTQQKIEMVRMLLSEISNEIPSERSERTARPKASRSKKV